VPATPPDLLVIDDDAGAGIIARASLPGRKLHFARSKAEGLTQFGAHRPRLVLLDVGLPDGDGLGLIEAFLGIDPFTQIIVITGNAEVDVVVRAMRAGAIDFLEKPFVPEQLVARVTQAERRLPSGQLGRSIRLAGESKAILDITDRLLRVALADVTALITGETGTGKELAARAVHDLSGRAGKPFVAVNCAAISPSLLESELFGYERGAFTGAASDGKRGLFEAAAGGTVLLDEIGETSQAFQATLLRVLEARTLRRVGGVVERPIDVRVVASTNRDLGREVREGRFRSDLYFRLSVVRIVLPPLRVRAGDVRVLAHHFLAQLASSTGRALDGFTPAAMAALEAHPWPGNVRELRNVVERATIFCATPRIDVADLELEPADEVPLPMSLPPALQADAEPGWREGSIVLDGPRLDEAEQVLIRHALALAGGHQGRAAKLLGINRTTLYKKLKRQGDGAAVGDDDAAGVDGDDA
jgi:DNA-binding NtrC family response regulator